MSDSPKPDPKVETAAPGFARPFPARLLAAALAIPAILILAGKLDAKAGMQSALGWIESLGFWGPAAFILAYIIATVALLPGSVLTLGAGAVFGLFHGFLYVSIGSTIGATSAFLVGRYFARDWVTARISGNRKFAAIDEAIAEEGWKIIGLLRLSPMFPFNLLNYGCALTKVSLRDYFFASWIGMIPGTIMWVYIGHLGHLAAADEDHAAKSLKVGGFIATALFTVLATRIARKSLERRLAQSPERPKNS